MNKKLFYVVLAITCLALAVMACSALSSIPSLANPGGSSGSGGSSSSSGGSNSNGNTNGTTGKVLFRDDFSDSTSGWGTGSDANKDVSYSNNTLEFKVFKANDMVYSTPSDTNYQDVHIEVTVTPNSSDPNTAFGILCDQQVTSDSFYYVAISPAGQYAIAKAAVAKDDVFLTNNNDWATSKLIPSNAPSYTVGMDCSSDGTLTLYVNGKKIDSASDTTYTKGHVGLFAWSDKQANSADVNFASYVVTSTK